MKKEYCNTVEFVDAVIRDVERIINKYAFVLEHRKNKKLMCELMTKESQFAIFQIRHDNIVALIDDDVGSSCPVITFIRCTDTKKYYVNFRIRYDLEWCYYPIYQ